LGEGLFREIVGPYILIVGAFGIYFLFSVTSGWRSLLGWVIFLSVQLPIENDYIRPAVSDFFLPFMFLYWILHSKDSLPSYPSRLAQWVILFAALFLFVGNTIAFIQLGVLPKWTLVNKDVGLVALAAAFLLANFYIRTKEQLIDLVNVFLISSLFINIAALLGGIARYIFGIVNPMMRDYSSLRLVGFNINPGSYGGWLIVVILLQFSLLLNHSPIIRMRRSLQWLTLIVASINVVMTLSRSAYLGLAAGILAVLIIVRKASARNLAIISILVAVSMSYIFRHSGSSNLDEDFQNNAYRSDTAEQRVTINEVALQLFLESPINIPFGVGIGTFLTRSGELLGHTNQIHNTFLWILVEMGCIGFFVLLMMFYRAFADCKIAARSNWTGQPIAIGVMASIIGTLGWFMGDEGLWHRHVWFVLILADAVYRIYLREVDFNQLVESCQGYPQLAGDPSFVER
jgi:O-antigen ligase